MKQLKILLLSSMVMLFTACGGEDKEIRDSIMKPFKEGFYNKLYYGGLGKKYAESLTGSMLMSTYEKLYIQSLDRDECIQITDKAFNRMDNEFLPLPRVVKGINIQDLQKSFRNQTLLLRKYCGNPNGFKEWIKKNVVDEWNDEYDNKMTIEDIINDAKIEKMLLARKNKEAIWAEHDKKLAERMELIKEQTLDKLPGSSGKQLSDVMKNAEYDIKNGTYRFKPKKEAELAQERQKKAYSKAALKREAEMLKFSQERRAKEREAQLKKEEQEEKSRQEYEKQKKAYKETQLKKRAELKKSIQERIKQSSHVTTQTQDSPIHKAKRYKYVRQDNFTFEGKYKITGSIKKVQYYGPPGYGEDPKHDKKLSAFILKLQKPITVTASSSDEINYTTKANEVQLVTADFIEQLNLAFNTHEKVSIEGEFFSSHTGYHIRKLLIDVKSVQILE